MLYTTIKREGEGGYKKSAGDRLGRQEKAELEGGTLGLDKGKMIDTFTQVGSG